MSTVVSHLNFTTGNRGVLFLPHLKTTTFTAQEFSIPGLSLPAARWNSPFAVEKVAGEKLEYDSLVVTFAVDEDLTNWNEIFTWMRELSAPETKDEYQRQTHDAFMYVANSNFQPSIRFQFEGIVPTRLSPITYATTEAFSSMKTASLMLEFNHMKVERVST